MSQSTPQNVSLRAPRSPLPAASHRYAIEYFTRDGRRLGQLPVAPDFQPALEHAYFNEVRRGGLTPVTAPAAGDVLPLWSDELGPPYCRGIGVHLNGAAAPAPQADELPVEFFHALAEANASVYVKRGELGAGDRYRYAICAYPVDAPEPHGPDGLAGLRIEAEASPIPLAESSLDAWLTRARAEGEPDPADAPVLLAESVLEQTCALALEAGELETGGVLVGRLHRDRTRPEVFAEIAAQIPARHATAGKASFAFTPETWAAADAALALRGSSELILGWWHSHPRFCRNCPEERWRSCALARPFFSNDDIHLHRTCFPQAYQVALLISDLPDAGPTPALFGWRAGQVVPRAYHAARAADPNEASIPQPARPEKES